MTKLTGNYSHQFSSLKPGAFAIALGILAGLSATNAEAAQQTVNLLSTSRFAVLAGSGITSVPTSDIRGDVGVSPSARSTIAGLTPVEVTGSIFAADDGGATAVMLTAAKGDLSVTGARAFMTAAARSLRETAFEIQRENND
ncbi:MAG TPA: ice-binding family protein [Verrucomicrobiae bacterium]|nr:ice-binding family protein [Verrucomicrobiae bacterium]